MSMATMPAPLAGHTSAKVPGATHLLISGGESPNPAASHILLFEPNNNNAPNTQDGRAFGSWSAPPLSKNDTASFHRLYHASLTTGRDGAILHGGYFTTPAERTVVASIVTLKSTAHFVPTSSTPVGRAPHGPALARHTMTLTTDGHAIILGGIDPLGNVANLSIAYTLDTQSPNAAWKAIPLNGPAPDPRMAFSTVLINSTTMLVYGGTKDFVSAYSNPSYLDLDSWTWSTPETKGDAPSRWGHTAVMSGSSMVVAFGKSISGPSSSVALFDINTNTWTNQFRPVGMINPDIVDTKKKKLSLGAVLGITFVITVFIVGCGFCMMVRQRKRRTRNTLARENQGNHNPRSALRREQSSQSNGLFASAASFLGLSPKPSRDRSSKRYSEMSSHSDPLKISLRMAQLGYSPLSLGYPDAVVQQGSGIVPISSHIYPNQACVETEKEPDGQETVIVYHTLTQAQQEALKLSKQANNRVSKSKLYHLDS
ncbi:hypothetical protein BGZ94_004825 [Podila epigama]|nr:hypothetical protein BGZ94_004825 [Podila epigama]